MSGAVGAVPDIVMGKDPGKALLDGALSVGGSMIGANFLPGIVAGDSIGIPPNPFATDGGLLGGMKNAGDYLKPIGQVAGAASQAGLLGHPQQMPASPPVQSMGTGAQTLAQIAQIQSPGMQQMQAAEEARRQRRMGLLGGM